MKYNESDFLNKLFTAQEGQERESDNDFPLLDPPTSLRDKLYAISESAKNTQQQGKKRSSISWPKFASVAATLLMAVVLVQNYQQQQTLKQLEQAQSDLATALRYLGEANQITRAHMLNTLNKNMKKAAIEPVVEIGRETVSPAVESLDSASRRKHRTL